MVAITELLAWLACYLLDIFLTVNALCVHCHKSGETIATMDVESLSHRAETVGSIDVTTIVAVVDHTPTEVCWVVRVLPIVLPERIEIVDISTFCTQNLSEYTLLSHIQGGHLIPVVAAVLEHFAMETLTLGEVDEFPALLKVHCSRYLDSNILAMLESIFCYREMVVPVGSDINEVDVLALTEFLVAIFATIHCCRWEVTVAQKFLAGFCVLLVVVAETLDFHAIDE